MNIRITIVLILLVFTVFKTLGQGKIFDHLSVEDGLTDNYINAVLQDSRGFIWFGTNNGLNRYDGFKSKIFLSDDKDSTTLSNNWISSIIEDESGNLWIGTEGGGLNYYDSNTGKFKRFMHNNSDPTSLSSDVVINLFKDSKGNIWVGTGQGLSLIDQEAFTFQNWDGYKNCSGCTHVVSAIAEDQKGNLWVGDEVNGLYYFDTITEQFSSPFQTNDKEIFSFFVNDLIFEDEYLYIATADGLKVLNTITQEFESIESETGYANSVFNAFIIRFYKGENGDIWMCSDGSGLALYNKADKKVEVYNTDQGLSSNSVTDVMIDFSNNLWVVTRGGGANKFNLKNRMFRHWGAESTNSNSLVSSEVRAILQDKENVIWVGTNNGLSRFDQKTDVFKNYVKDFNYQADQSSPKIRLIYRDQTDNLWVSTQNGGFYKYIVDEDRFISDVTYLESEATRGVRKVASIYEKSRNLLWLCTDGSGILEYDKSEKKITKVIANNDETDVLNTAIINVVLEKNPNEVWLGTDGGLVVMNTGTYQPEFDY